MIACDVSPVAMFCILNLNLDSPKLCFSRQLINMIDIFRCSFASNFHPILPLMRSIIYLENVMEHLCCNFSSPRKKPALLENMSSSVELDQRNQLIKFGQGCYSKFGSNKERKKDCWQGKKTAGKEKKDCA